MKRRPLLVKAGALALVAILVAVGGWFALVAPQRSHARDLSGRIAAAQAKLLALEAIGTDSGRVSAAQLYQLARAMPADDDVPGILLDLDRASTAAGVRLVSIKPSQRVAMPDGSFAVPVTAVVEGRYAKVTAFLARLRRQVRNGAHGVAAAGRLFAVDQAGLQVAGDGVTATLQLDAFDYAAPSPTTTTATPPSTPGAEAAGGAQ
ncbi:MAG TPA: type 4a pilus biogenesis protein PilO [Gaiellaceae bacterium]